MGRGLGVVVAIAAAVAIAGCDEVRSLFGGGWRPTGTNGQSGELRFGLDAFDFRKDDPEHVRIERHETRTVMGTDGNKHEETRDRTVQVVSARCRPASLCDAEPFLTDTRDVVLSPHTIGGGTLEVTVMLDGDEEVHDKVEIRVGL